MLLERLSLKEGSGEKVVNIGAFINIISHRGFGAILLLLSLPAALPFPAVGYAIPFGLLIILFGLQLLIGRNFPWLPHRISQKQLYPGFISFLKKKGLPFLKKAERWSTRRMEFTTQKPFHVVTGLIVGLMGAIMVIPIPFTNTLPALVVFIIGLGLVADDGLFILGGLVAGGIFLATYIVITVFAVGMIL